MLIFKLDKRRKSSFTTIRIEQQGSFGRSETVRRKRKFSRMNRIVIGITFSFILSTLPIACASFFFSFLEKTAYGQFLIVFLDSLSMSYHAFNILISYFSNKIFKKEVNRYLKLGQSYNCSLTTQLEL
jgi:hypothetical protein